jgi:hypothetical protein
MASSDDSKAATRSSGFPLFFNVKTIFSPVLVAEQFCEQIDVFYLFGTVRISYKLLNPLFYLKVVGLQNL